jgi:hypothetical protein
LLEIRNLYNPKSTDDAIISANIMISKKDFLNILDEELSKKYENIESFQDITISRNLTTKEYSVSIIDDPEDSKIIGKTIVSKLPYIIYNDDFIERPKNIIDIPTDKSDLSGWKGIMKEHLEKLGILYLL